MVRTASDRRYDSNSRHDLTTYLWEEAVSSSSVTSFMESCNNKSRPVAQFPAGSSKAAADAISERVADCAVPEVVPSHFLRSLACAWGTIMASLLVRGDALSLVGVTPPKRRSRRHAAD